ncbi:MAG: hypothetical protein E7277_04870 [Lachnospiraceae bacterium]|jgi:predicted house-cleaning noncanonical NTP pyrophosphatase (MazG superfamily)|nr:hypothetical protein [Lachnospiraceae bacterium]
MKEEYYKLVRDKVPEIMKSEGAVVQYQIMEDKYYRQELFLKLREEARELMDDPHDIEEYADILEVLDCIMKLHGISFDAVMETKEKKRLQKGSFTEKYFLYHSETI